MRLRYKILIGLLLVLLIGPFLVPVNTSGTLTKEEAAEEVWGSQSQFVELAGQEVPATSGDEEPVDMLAGVEIDTQPAKQPSNEWIVDQKFASPMTSGFEFDVKEGMAEVELVVTGP
jgi:hypothetical protein